MKDCPLPRWNQRVKPPRVAKRTGDLACNKQRTHILISSNIGIGLNGRNHQVNHESRPLPHHQPHHHFFLLSWSIFDSSKTVNLLLSCFSFIENKRNNRLWMLFGALSPQCCPRERSRAQRTTGAPPSPAAPAAPPYALVHAAVPQRSWEVGRY